MSRSVTEWAGDIREAVLRCLRYVGDLESKQGHLAEMALDAIERNIAVIGEAAKHLPEDVTSEIPQVDWAAIRGMRNIIIHEYFRVDPHIVRDVIETELLPLAAALDEYLDG